MSKVDSFYLKIEEPNQSCLLALRGIILGCSIEITETLKYGMPCFCYSKEIVCYLWIDKKTTMPYILFANGEKLKNPILDTGGRKKMKSLTVNSNTDIPVKLIQELVCTAIS